MADHRRRELASIDITSGVSAFTGKGFCLVEAVQVDGARIAAQMTPDEVRQMALGWLGAAEAAEHDAAVHAALIEDAGLSRDLAGAFIVGLRDRRAANTEGGKS